MAKDVYNLVLSVPHDKERHNPPYEWDWKELLDEPDAELLVDPVVLIVGSVVDGVSVVGPFTDIEEASAYAEREGERDWSVARLWLPEGGRA